MAIDFKALGGKAVETGVNMTVAQTGGGDYTPPAEGFCFVRLVAYVELGKQQGTFQGKPVVKDKVQLVFELSGPKHTPEERDGVKYPHRITLEETLSLNEKARFFKLFQRMNYKGDAQHMIQLLGEGYKAKVIHRKYKGKDGKERIAVDLYDKTTGTYTIEPPRVEATDDTGMPTGEYRALNVPAAVTPLKGFIWALADMEQWNSLFIEGSYPERKNEKGEVTAPAKSKNVLQNTIKAATNFKASPIYALLAANGVALDLTDAERPVREGEDDEGEASAAAQASAAIAQAAKVETPTGAAADDALNGVL